MNKFEELLKKYEKTVDDITFTYEGLSDEELEAAFAKAFNTDPAGDPAGSPKRIAAIETEEEQEDMLEELIDRFGDPPRKVQQLLMIAQLKAKAHAAYVISVEQKGDEYKFTMYEKARVNVAKIPELLYVVSNCAC